MNTRLFTKTVLSTALIAFLSLQYSAAQDSIKRAVETKPPVIKPKPTANQPGAGYTGKTIVNKTTVVQPLASSAGYQAKPAPLKPAAATALVKTYTPPMVSPSDRSLNGQYQFLLGRTYGYMRPMVAAFYKSVSDTLAAERGKIKPMKASVTALKDSITALHKQLSTQEHAVSESSAKVDSISLLGINMTKSAYNTLMWGLVVAFGAIAAFVIFRSGSYSREAKYRIKLYEDLDDEYKTYKAKSNEKEKKLARELQTARNKIEEITGNPY